MLKPKRSSFALPYGRSFGHKILFLFFLFSLTGTPSALGKTLSGKVLKVFDGDTLLIRVPEREEHVRLREIDAPEITHQHRMGQEPWGRKAKEYAQSLVKGKTVWLEIEEGDERDKFHRLLAYVFWGETFVNREMVRSGNAFFFPGLFKGKYAAELQEAEEVARLKGLGVWDRKNGLQERPQEFRSRTQREESFFSKGWRIIGVQKEKTPPKENPVPEDKVVANKRSMIYHLPGSAGASQVNPQNRILFDTPEEAEKAGFRRAKSGRPIAP